MALARQTPRVTRALDSYLQTSCARRLSTATRLHAVSDFVPRVARPSFWKSLVPKPFRRGEEVPTTRRRGAEGWLFFIIMPLLIGSQAIQLIVVKKELAEHSRQSKAKIDLLKEVLGRIQNGGKFDVGKALGGGDPVQEEEWDVVLQEVKNGPLFTEKEKKTPWSRGKAKVKEPQEKEEPKSEPERRNQEPAPFY